MQSVTHATLCGEAATLPHGPTGTTSIVAPPSAKQKTASPFSVRPLTRPERRRGDLYLYRSPKLSRTVELIGCVNTALALTLEFDPRVTAYVERPRKLTLASGTSIELAFWTRERKGRERFWLPVAASDTLHTTTPRREHRQARDIIEAAQIAHIDLEFFFEDDLRRQSAVLSTWYRLLPYVQTARTLPHRESLSQQIMAMFQILEKATVEQIELQLQAFHAADVRAVLFDLMHRGELAMHDPTRLGRFSVLTRRGSHD
ncbi:hypothetical protein [Dyella koreensis]|uniref:TnsA endonuclease N-terminal domain-containing protein n=1 Tax=Dyella koreensis TaxID=311235 RepID=A0ABW8KB47_9GAMM